MTPFHKRSNGEDMNYEPNTVKWKPGDLVLHDADAKEWRVMMRVVNYAVDGRCPGLDHSKSGEKSLTISTNGFIASS